MLRVGKVEFEVRGVRKDGSIFDKHLVLSAVDDGAGQVIGHYCFMKDLSERKQADRERAQAKQALQTSEEQLRLALELTSIGSWDWTLATDRILWNANHYRLFGYQPGKIELSYQHWRDRVYPGDLAQAEEKLTQAIANQTDYEAEYRIILADGTIRWILGKGRALYNESGEAVCVEGLVFDITDKKQLEALFYQAQRLESLATLVRGIAHDLNNVLTPMLLIAQMMGRIQPNLNQQAQKILKLLEQSAQRGAQMVQQILTFTQGPEGEPTLQGAAIDPREQESKPSQGHGELVLIVEDDQVVQQVTKLLLEQHHYATAIAKDGLEAIEVYTQRHADIKLVLLDVMMPNMDGVMTAQTLRKINPQVPIIAMSGLPAKQEPILAAGARSFLVKPYTAEDLLSSVHHTVLSA